MCSSDLSHRLQTGHSFPSEPNWKIIVQPVVCFHTIRPVFSKITPFSPVLGRLFKSFFSKSPRFFQKRPTFLQKSPFFDHFQNFQFSYNFKKHKGRNATLRSSLSFFSNSRPLFRPVQPPHIHPFPLQKGNFNVQPSGVARQAAARAQHTIHPGAPAGAARPRMA